MSLFPPSRAAALLRLTAFTPHAGRDYATSRNADLPGHPHVSGLSPYIRHRLLTEPEVLTHILNHHSPSAADKFVSEVFWRTYWKGWLEMRPAVWSYYKTGLNTALNRVQTETQLHDDWQSACLGTTGIACFDHWALELATTGYLHNHARMWFASIWIFTLRLPWELGADFFLRHLLDGDPASNTLSWRWVAGIQTPGKTYLARPDNIALYTNGRFHPTGLATQAQPVSGATLPAPGRPPVGDIAPQGTAIGLIVTEEDLNTDWLLDHGIAPVSVAVLEPQRRSPLATAPPVTAFVRGAMADCTSRLSDTMGRINPVTTIAEITDWARQNTLRHVVTAYTPTGPVADCLSDLRKSLALHDISLHLILRSYDAQAWPLATHGFFKFRDAIPRLIGTLITQRQAELPFI